MTLFSMPFGPNIEWKNEAKSTLSNATLLLHESIEIKLKKKPDEERKTSKVLRIFGTEFFWPCKGHNPYFDQIDETMDVVVSHCPAHGHVDNGRGCPSLASALKRVRPNVVISGHEHSAGHGVTSCNSGITYVNAATAGKHHSITRQPIILLL